MASLERLSEVPELVAWFREGLRESGRTEEEIDQAELRLNGYLTRKVRPVPKPPHGQLAFEVEEPEEARSR
jgi:hypothetical protein